MINRLLLLQKLMIFRAKWAEPVEPQPKVHATFLVELFSDKKRPMLDLVQCAPIRKDDDTWYEELEKMLRKFSTNK